MASETIVAVATPPGCGGIGVIRLSGKNALDIATKLTRAEKAFKPRFAHYVSFYALDTTDPTPIDTGLLICFKAPHSFTGEDVVEIQSHGAPFVLDRLISEALLCGARLAKPGEFSERAFLNDKMDLVQAEAIADLIHANSETSARLATRSLQGDFSKQIHAINHQLIALRLFIEASIDFSDEAIDFLEEDKVKSQFQTIYDSLDTLCQGATQGSRLREGSVVVLSGPPNVGKSTLLNALSGYERAIVHDEAGTTRDIMREAVLIDNVPVELIDTAGLRESESSVEQEGVRRARDAIKRSDAVLMIFDATKQNKPADEAIDAEIRALLPSSVPIIRVFNKIDKLDSSPSLASDTLYLSAKTKQGLDDLKEAIKKALGHAPSEGLFLARRRHIDALNRAKACLVAAKKQLSGHKQSELLAEDLRQAHDVLSEVIGEFTTEDLLGEIFSSFCIGK